MTVRSATDEQDTVMTRRAKLARGEIKELGELTKGPLLLDLEDAMNRNPLLAFFHFF